MGVPKFPQGGLWVEDKSVKQGGKRSIKDLPSGLRELAGCNACGCDDCKGYETIIIASTGELAVRYYTGAQGGPYTEVIEPFDVGIANIQALYDARFLTPTATPTPTAT